MAGVKLLALIGIALVSGGAAKPALRPVDLDPLTLSAHPAFAPTNA